MKLQKSILGLLASAFLSSAGCGESSSNGTGTAGSGGGGSSGAAGTTGAGGTSGAGGAAGATGAGGTAGGSAGAGGAAGATGAGGTAGATGAGGSAGATGAAGGAGSGVAGSGGAAGAGAGGRGGSGGAAGSGSGGRGGASSGGGATGSGGAGGASTANAMMNFFVTSETSTTANLGGLAAADARCQRLAAAVGHGSKTWRAYLSVASPATNARDRIGEGPYYNSLGVMLAATKDALHARSGDATLFIDERGTKINGQWQGSPSPVQHDILTGSTATGMLMSGNTCADWTATTGMSLVGHSDGLGPSMNSDPPYNQWAGSHEGECGNTAARGGSGRTYCFVAP